MCNECSHWNNGISYEKVSDNLSSKGFILDTPKEQFRGLTLTPLICHDSHGYYYKVTYDAIMRGKRARAFDKSNPFVIQNINHFLIMKELPFKCVSSIYTGEHDNLDFICTRCGEHIYKTWANTYRPSDNNRTHIQCPNCDGRLESMHALVLKQLFCYYYPDTVVEEKSCVNPLTNTIMPTDIVNHSLKIAIEIQSEWHDNEYSKIKDDIKKNFWLSKGYKFYDPDIRDYTILEMCQLFFDIDTIPDFINYDYSNKLNLKQVQALLNTGMTVPKIAQQLDVNKHRIYDAIGAKKLFYPSDYIAGGIRPVVQLDKYGVLHGKYTTIAEAAKINHIHPGCIASAFKRKTHYANGYYWYDVSDYENDNVVIIPSKRDHS